MRPPYGTLGTLPYLRTGPLSGLIRKYGRSSWWDRPTTLYR